VNAAVAAQGKFAEEVKDAPSAIDITVKRFSPELSSTKARR
jgi:hypothetical protein